MTYPAAINSIPSHRARISGSAIRYPRSKNSIPRPRVRINSCRIRCNTDFTSYPTRGKRCLARSIRRPRTLIRYPCASFIATAHAKPLQSPSKRDAMAISKQAGSSSESNFTTGTSHGQFPSDDRGRRLRRMAALELRKILPRRSAWPVARSQTRKASGVDAMIGALLSPRTDSREPCRAW